MTQVVYLDGTKIFSAKSFFQEIERELLIDSNAIDHWSLDVFDDVLQGGFGRFNIEDGVQLIWSNYRSSVRKTDAKILQEILEILAAHEHVEVIFD
ncbi:MAG: hypothetical protein AAFN81_19495 [Bacteroidota bacterium]